MIWSSFLPIFLLDCIFILFLIHLKEFVTHAKYKVFSSCICCKYFSSCCGLPFCSLTRVIREVLKCNIVYLLIVSLMVILFCVPFKKCYLTLRSWRYSSKLSSESFTVSFFHISNYDMPRNDFYVWYKVGVPVLF